ncbi:Protein of unknown function [Gryllus bimaculatus]|nr:Protein of unknown function [Gryllus bimaculatus]
MVSSGIKPTFRKSCDSDRSWTKIRNWVSSPRGYLRDPHSSTYEKKNTRSHQLDQPCRVPLAAERR